MVGWWGGGVVGLTTRAVPCVKVSAHALLHEICRAESIVDEYRFKNNRLGTLPSVIQAAETLLSFASISHWELAGTLLVCSWYLCSGSIDSGSMHNSCIEP